MTSLPGETVSPLGNPDLSWPEIPDQVFRWPSFTNGMDYTGPDGTLKDGWLRLAENVLLTKIGSLIYPSGVNPNFSINSGNLEVYDFIRFRRDADADVATGFDAWVMVRNNAGTRQFCWTDVSGVLTVLQTVTANAPQDTTIIQVGKRAITTSRDNLPVVWYGTGASTTLGYPEPAAGHPAITLPVPSFGVNMGNEGFDPYQYTYAFEDKFGNITNPQPDLSDPLMLLNPPNWTVTVKVPSSGLPTGYNTANLSRIHIYRIGGKSSELRETFSFVPGSLSGGYYLDNATGAFPIDFHQDSVLPDIFPTYSNLPPPRGLLTLKEHQGRLYGAGQSSSATIAAELGSSSRLWFSRPDMPESWGFEDDGVDDDGGFVDIDDNAADPIMCLESTGSVLVIARRQSIYTLFGSGFTSYRFDKRSDIGVPSRRSMCRRGNTVVFLGSDTKVYELGDRDPVCISLPVYDHMRTKSGDITKGVLFMHEGRLHVCMPKISTTGSYTYILDDNTGGWTELAGRFDVNAAKSINQPSQFRPSCLIAQRAGVAITQEYYYELQNNTSDAPYVTVDIETDRIRFSEMGDRASVTEFYLDVLYVGALNITIEAEGSSETYSFSNPTILFASPIGNRLGLPLGTIQSPIHLKGLPPYLDGSWFSIRITGSVQVFEMRKMFVKLMPSRGSL